MPAFLQDITPFRGDGGRNESGQSLEEFLADYRHEDYECPSVTADILVFCMKQNREPVPENLKLLMVKRRNHPCIHSWALPGGFLEIREDAAAAAARELEEETGLTGIPMEQLGCYANYDRDPRWRLVTISFLALLEPGFHNVAAGDDAADAVWMDVDCHRETERTDNQRQYEPRLRRTKFYGTGGRGEPREPPPDFPCFALHRAFYKREMPSVCTLTNAGGELPGPYLCSGSHTGAADSVHLRACR